jgi:hypothetical protein
MATEGRATITAGKTPAASEERDDQELIAALEQIRHLIETSAVEEARALAKEMAARWPDDKDVRHWARVLAPAKARVIPGRGGRPLDQERAWLREHAHEYPGCWLAVYGDQLIAADPDLSQVMRIMRQTPGGDEAALHLQGPYPLLHPASSRKESS